MLRIMTVFIGMLLIFVGIAGFIPDFKTNGFLFALLEVSFFHNILYLVTGVFAIMSATRYQAARLYLQIIGILYAILALLGFLMKGDLSFILMHMNLADNFFHLILGLLCLYFGYIWSRVRNL